MFFKKNNKKERYKGNKKGLSVIVSTILLMLIASSLVILYSIWGSGFFSEQISKYYYDLDDIEIVKLENYTLYIKNYNDKSFNNLSLRINSNECMRTNISKGITKINLSTCISYFNETTKIVIFSEDIMLSKTFYR